MNPKFARNLVLDLAVARAQGLSGSDSTRLAVTGALLPSTVLGLIVVAVLAGREASPTVKTLVKLHGD